MGWGDDVPRDIRLVWDGLCGPGLLYKLERQFWLDLYRVPVLDAIEEDGIETRHYGPIRAMVNPDLARLPLFNVVLGASDPGAVEEGHLEEALDWIDSKEIDCRVPVRPEFEESGAAEDHLNHRGYRRSGQLLRFVRDAAPPPFSPPSEIEVDEWTEETEGFSGLFSQALELDWLSNPFFDGLPGRRDWRCYVAYDPALDLATGAGIMMHHYEVAQLGFVATIEEGQGRGAHMALLHRRIVDAAATGARLIFADVELPTGAACPSSASARNLIRAGFSLAGVRPVWRPPA